jgi:hypothetical protein
MISITNAAATIYPFYLYAWSYDKVLQATKRLGDFEC